jgi:hypothetical protein
MEKIKQEYVLPKLIKCNTITSFDLWMSFWKSYGQLWSLENMDPTIVSL